MAHADVAANLSTRSYVTSDISCGGLALSGPGIIASIPTYLRATRSNFGKTRCIIWTIERPCKACGIPLLDRLGKNAQSSLCLRDLRALHGLSTALSSAEVSCYFTFGHVDGLICVYHWEKVTSCRIPITSTYGFSVLLDGGYRQIAGMALSSNIVPACARQHLMRVFRRRKFRMKPSPSGRRSTSDPEVLWCKSSPRRPVWKVTAKSAISLNKATRWCGRISSENCVRMDVNNCRKL